MKYYRLKVYDTRLFSTYDYFKNKVIIPGPIPITEDISGIHIHVLHRRIYMSYEAIKIYKKIEKDYIKYRRGMCWDPIYIRKTRFFKVLNSFKKIILYF